MSDTNFTTVKNIILNLAVGGDFGGNPNATTVFPQTMLVDYVRVWHRPTGLTGDYNLDGTVDNADYVLWRKSAGQTGIGLNADGSGNASVGPEDYDTWRKHFDVSLLGAAATTAILAVPEPNAATQLTAVTFVLIYSQRLRWRAPN